jgi:4-alpha-glucanotransferase
MTDDEGQVRTRSSGVLLHVTSLPGPYGSGDLGPSARSFVDFLAEGKQRYWQTLPVNPVGLGNSPYSGLSAFAGNPLLISLDDLVARGLLRAGELEAVASGAQVDFAASAKLRGSALRTACQRMRESVPDVSEQLHELRERHRYWLADYALFCAARSHYGGRPWTAWEPALARHDPSAVKEASRTWADEIELREIEQLLFDQQWSALRRHASDHQVELIGDAPLFVDHDSADVWAHQDLFQLDARGQPSHVSGVPPDYFSSTGQRWGMPLYRWKVLARDDYRFWVERLSTLLARFDSVRLDHFIGFVRYWEIPAQEKTAIKGRWLKGPGAELFAVLQRALKPQGLEKTPWNLPFIAEDLGCVNDDVRILRHQFALPGMRVLQFGFGGASEHLPHNYPTRCVAYTGTHDTNTIVGFLGESRRVAGAHKAPEVAHQHHKALAYAYGPGATHPQTDAHLPMIRLLFASAADTVIVPMQDWLGQGVEARMNTPGLAEGNWGYRLQTSQLTEELSGQLRAYTETYQRCPIAESEASAAAEGNP